MMKRLSILLDDLALIRSLYPEGIIDPPRFGILAENAGANGLVCTFSGSSKGISEKDLRLLKEMNRSFLNVRIPLQNEAMRLALSVAPDMVTFVDVKPNDPRKVSPLDLSTFPGEIDEMIPNLQSNNIAVSVLVRPEVDFLKAISKLSIDYVEIDAAEFTSAPDINDEIVALDKMKSAALALGKWGIGVNCSGNISLEDLAALAQVPNLEDIILGSQFIQRTFYVGINQSVREALDIIRSRELE
jgi:pyridoxine 5-phosphate synthase